MRRLATKTLEKIEAYLERDQGNAYRKLLRDIMPQLDDAYRENDSEHRTHLGASLIGGKCPRKLWYTFRWSTRSKFPGRIIRLFNRGHLEEGRFVALLRMIGCEFYQFDENGDQFRIAGADGHYGGGLDGVVVGVEEVDGVPILAEFKTHNSKSFEKLVNEGVYSAKNEHYVQMNQYMGHWSLPFALYLATNKDNDELYGEIVTYDPVVDQYARQRAERIIYADVPPARISKTSTWYECKYCEHRPVCWNKQSPDRTCRTCVWSKPTENKLWTCGFHSRTLDKEAQLAACPNYTQVNTDA